MPAYSTVQAFINAINTGKTHITQSLDSFFSNPAQVTGHGNWSDFVNSNWSAGPPAWLSGVLDNDVGLTPPERNHVLAWPGPELEKARDAAVRAVDPPGQAPARAPKFFWELYRGPTPRTDLRVSSAGDPEIVFRSPRAAVVIEGDEVFVRDVPLEPTD